MEFDDEAASRIFGGSENKLAMFVFYEDNEEGRKAKQALAQAAPKLRKKMFLATSTVDGDG